MALGLQRLLVRHARNTAQRDLRALRRAAGLSAILVGLSAAAACAQPAAESRNDRGAGDASDAASWFAAPGRAGWVPDRILGSGAPQVFAGHVRGSIVFEQRWRPPDALPSPGVRAGTSPLVWWDSLRVRLMPSSVTDAFAASLVSAADLDTPAVAGRERRAYADVLYESGSSAMEQAALGVRRGSGTSWNILEVASGERGAIGALGDAGTKEVALEAGKSWNRSRWEAAFGRRASAGSLEGSEEQVADQNAGRLGFATTWSGWAFTLEAERSQGFHESFGDSLVHSRRDADGWSATAEVRADSASRWSVHAGWRLERVRRSTDGEPGLESRVTSWWLGTRWSSPAREGLELELSGGRHGGVDRLEIVPALRYRFAGGPFTGSLFARRSLAPVWSDLAPGGTAFLQKTWGGGAEVAAGGEPVRLGMSWMMGRTHDRALLSRVPLDDLWLRAGHRRDLDAFDFGLLRAAAAWAGRYGGIRTEGFVLSRDRSALQPNLDPGYGARSEVEARFQLFRGDLGVRLRLGADLVGSRDSEASPSRPLEGYVTSHAAAVFTVADFRLALLFRGLENRPQPQSWISSRTGREAMGPGLENVVRMDWRLFD